MNLEQAYKRLEEILNLMNGANLPLEQSLALYEEADALLKQCSEQLLQAEQKIEMLVREREGKLTPQPFSV